MKTYLGKNHRARRTRLTLIGSPTHADHCDKRLRGAQPRQEMISFPSPGPILRTAGADEPRNIARLERASPRPLQPIDGSVEFTNAFRLTPGPSRTADSRTCLISLKVGLHLMLVAVGCHNSGPRDANGGNRPSFPACQRVTERQRRASRAPFCVVLRQTNKNLAV